MALILLITSISCVSIGGGIIAFLILKYPQLSRHGLAAGLPPMRAEDRRALIIGSFMLLAGAAIAIAGPMMLGL